jgi:hypothetical protein
MMDYNFDIYKFQSGGVLPTQENLTFRGANIDFGDYISPDTRLIASNAAFAQKTANDRLDAIMKEKEKIIDAIKLDKQYGKLTGQLTGQLNSLVEQAAQSQLSDNANFTKFNTGLMSIQRDPVIQNALRSTEHAKAYADMRIKSPEIVDKDYLNNGMEKDWQRFKNGETDEFVLRPVYTEPKWREEIYDFVKNIPIEEKEEFKTYGSGIYQENVKGKNADSIRERTKSKINELLTKPDTASHFQRMAKYGYDPLSAIQQTLNSAIDQYKSESIIKSNMTTNPNVLTPYQQQSLAISRMNANTSRMNALDRIEGEERPGGKGSSFVDYFGREIYMKGEKEPISDTDRKYKMQKLLIDSKQSGTGRDPILLSDTKSTIAKDESNNNIRYNINYSPTGDFYEQDNSVFVEVKSPDDIPYFVKYDKDVFEKKIFGNQSPTTPPPAKPKGQVDKNNPFLRK